jgi:hypothetical protein
MMKARLLLDYQPELAALKMTPKSDGKVFERLYRDATAKQRFSSLSPPAYKARPPIFRRSPDDQLSHVRLLMAKQGKSQEKIEQERLRLEEEQLKEVKERPYINQESRVLADKTRETQLEAYAKAELAASRHKKSKSDMIKLEVVKDRRLVTPDQIAAVKVTSEMVHLYTSRSRETAGTPTCKVNIITGEGSGLKLPRNEAREEINGRVSELRSIRELLAKSHNFDPIEPPDPLEMEFMDRGRYWVEQKSKNLQKKTENAIKLELEDCTFTPKISEFKGVSPSRMSLCSASLIPVLKYAEIHKSRASSRLTHKKDLESTTKSEVTSHAMKESKSGPIETPKPFVYASLSPVVTRCSVQSSSILKKLIKRTSKSKGGVSIRRK